jgi:hypothetical protein
LEYRPYKLFRDLHFSQLVLWGEVKVDLFYINLPPTVGVVVADQAKAGEMQLTSEGQTQVPHGLCAVDNAFPLRRTQFCNLSVLVPQQAELYLADTYGSNWATEVHVWNHWFNHEQELGHDPEKVKFSIREYTVLIEEIGYTPPSAKSTATASRSECVANGDVGRFCCLAADRRAQKIKTNEQRAVTRRRELAVLSMAAVKPRRTSWELGDGGEYHRVAVNESASGGSSGSTSGSISGSARDGSDIGDVGRCNSGAGDIDADSE